MYWRCQYRSCDSLRFGLAIQATGRADLFCRFEISHTSLEGVGVTAVARCGVRSQSGIDRLALHRQDRERALVDAPQRLPVDEALETLDAERKLP
jgi:hypothetical protein